jgi:magnesium-transporting ATPase (P-type)
MEEWELLRTFEFTSERKAMSVIVRDKKTKRVFVHVKGADSSILPKVTHARGENAIHKFVYQEELPEINDKVITDKARTEKKTCDETVERMARQGLRTLCYASREITNWDDSIDPQDIMAEEVERDLFLLCVTGVEDLLQDDVKACIEDFRHAGISVWMLTGDKGLTAQEIGVSCGLISEDAKDSN